MMKKSKNFCLIGSVCVSSVNIMMMWYRESLIASMYTKITKRTWSEGCTRPSTMRLKMGNNLRARAVTANNRLVTERKNTYKGREDKSDPGDNMMTALTTKTICIDEK